jgi:hypothetical protein
MTEPLVWGRTDYVDAAWEWPGFVLEPMSMDQLTEDLRDTVEALMAWDLDIDQPGRGQVTGHMAEYLRCDYYPELSAAFGVALDFVRHGPDDLEQRP